LISAVSFSGAGCLTSSPATIVVSAPLPVTLLNFTGRYMNDHTNLEWETAMEENAAYFAVERSDDGRQYTEIGKVKAAGNSNMRLEYAFTDNKPVINNAWYRLRPVDTDGTSKFSNVIRVANEIRDLSVLSVTPNPFESAVRVQVYADKVLPVAIRIVDITGREMFKLNSILSAGNNNILLQPATLVKGVYVLQMIAGNEVIWNQKIQKVK
jgi:hypothetical protein